MSRTAGPVDPRIVPFGDAALLVELGPRIDPLTNARVHALARAVLEAGSDAGIGQPVPAYASLLVPFDPLVTTTDMATRLVSDALAEQDEAAVVTSDEEAREPIEIAVRYGGEDGPDLDEVAAVCGMTPAQVVALHASVAYRAYMLGFTPGFAYLGELPAALELPRRATPRQRVPGGSVAIAGRQTAVYPVASPGGWHLIGRTDAPMWDVVRQPPALVVPGRRVRFVPA